jgi:hypothetical protein
MSASITFFPVSNGDMTLLKLDNGQTILSVDHIRCPLRAREAVGRR